MFTIKPQPATFLYKDDPSGFLKYTEIAFSSYRFRTKLVKQISKVKMCISKFKQLSYYIK